MNFLKYSTFGVSSLVSFLPHIPWLGERPQLLRPESFKLLHPLHLGPIAKMGIPVGK